MQNTSAASSETSYKSNWVEAATRGIFLFSRMPDLDPALYYVLLVSYSSNLSARES